MKRYAILVVVLSLAPAVRAEVFDFDDFFFDDAFRVFAIRPTPWGRAF